MGSIASTEKAQFVCPECLKNSKVHFDRETGERICMSCGFVISEELNMVHRLPFGTTYAPTSELAFNKSLGGTIDRKNITSVLIRLRGDNTDRIQKVRDVVTEHLHGELSYDDAGAQIRSILIKAGVPEIMEKLSKLGKQEKTPQEIAEKLVQDYDIVPIRQLMTVHDVHEPVFVRKVKSKCEAICKNNEDTLARFFDPKMFRHAVGKTVQKVTNAALGDPILTHKPKDLAAACFLETLRKMRPGVKVSLKHSPQESALQFVDIVMTPRWEELNASWKAKEVNNKK